MAESTGTQYNTRNCLKKKEIIGDEIIHIWVVARKLIVGFRNYLH